MNRIHNATIVTLLIGVLLGFAPGKAHAQAYVFGTASFAAPGLGPMITADFNGDAIPDLAVLGGSLDSQVISIFLGKPDGTFAPKVDYAVQASGFTVGDFNGDGKLDIVVVNNVSLPPASILLGNGDGTFQSPTPLNQTIPNGNYSTVVSADFNGDGKLDLVFFGYTGSLLVLLGNGDGTFQIPVTYSVPVGPYVSIGDFNGDGKPDIAVAGTIAGSYPASGQVSVLMNKGDGTFQNPVDYAITGEVQALAVADLNGDGKLDLVVPTGGYPSGVSVLLGMGDGTFASPVMYTSTLLSFYSASVAVADFNGDGKLDLALANSTPNNAVAILLGNGDGTFQNPPLLYSAGLDPDGVLALDVNRDGKPDLAVVGGYGVASYYSVTVLINQGDGTFPHATAYPALKYPWTAVVGDFNGDGKPDIAVASVTTTSTGQDNGGAVSVFLGNGDGTFEPRLDSPTSNFPFVIAPGDFNGDGKLDLVVVEGTPYGELLSTWIGNGDGTFQNNISQSLPNYARSLAVGDFNHDGKLDVAATVDYAGAVYVFLGNGDGTFTSPLSYATGAGTNYSGYNVIAADFNGDGNLDLAVTTDQGISILLGKGDGTFRPYTAILPGESLLAVGDFNGDGKPDLAIATGNNIISVALGNGDGTFQQASGYQITSILEFGSPTVGDFNGDGKLDIAFTSQYTGVVTILFGNGDGTFSRHMEFGTAQVPAIVAADFNGDGALDLAMTDVTNQQVSVLLSSAVAALYPSHLNFTSQLDGTPSPEQTVSMSNPSPVPISFSSIGTTGDFSEANNCDSKLMAGANCQVSVTFAPTADGIRSGMLIFNDNAADSPQTVSLSGTGVAVSLSTMSLSFGAQLVGSSSRETVTLTNLGSTPLSISSLSLVSLAPVTSLGTKAGDFAIQSSSCVAGGSVAALGSCTINVAFKPTAAGIQSATLVIRDSDPTSPQSVNLRGTGTAVRLSPTSLGFAPQPVDTTSVPRTVTLANLGNTPLRIESLTLGGTDAGDFAIQSNSTCAAGATVAGEGSCTINLAFKPSAAGARSATLVISDSDPGSPQTVSLSGRGR